MYNLKEEFLEGMKDLKNQILKQRWFLLSIAVLTITFLVAMFFEPVTYFAIGIILLIAIFFDFEKCLCLFLYSSTFEVIFYIKRENGFFDLFVLVYYAIFFICCLKYLIAIILSKRDINIKLLAPLILFIMFIFVPVNPVTIQATIKYIVALSVFYLLVENKKDIKIRNLVFYLSLGIVISCLVSCFIPLSQRVSEIVTIFKNYGIVKFKGLFANPNNLSIYVVFLFPFLISFCTQKRGFFWFLPLFPIAYFAYLTISRNYIICLFILIVYFIISVCIKRNKRSAFSLMFVLLTFLVVAISEINITKVYLVRFNILPEESIVVENRPGSDIGIEEPDDKLETPELWTDGTPLDPGRFGIWKRYIKDFISSPKNIIFGTGVNASELGIIPHNFYIYFMWRFGLLGTILICYAVLRVLIKMYKDFKDDSRNSFMLMILFTCAVERLFFNARFIVMIILLISCLGGVYESDDNRSSLQCRKIS